MPDPLKLLPEFFIPELFPKLYSLKSFFGHWTHTVKQPLVHYVLRLSSPQKTGMVYSTAVTKCHTPGGLSNRNLISCSLGG